jgi:hypothetical protein
LSGKSQAKTINIHLAALIFMVGLFMFFDLHLQAEIIKVSKLKGKNKAFSIKRDIFSPFKGNVGRKPVMRVEPPPPPKIEEKKPKEVKPDVAEEISGSVAFEGYVMRNARKLALLTVNGEFFVVGKDDLILDKIKIINVDKEQVTVEVDSTVIEIKLKGDDENEIF